LNWLPLNEAAQALSVPERTLRRYIAAHGGHILHRMNGRALEIEAGSLGVMAGIRDAYQRGLRRADVERTLNETAREAVMDVTPKAEDVAANALALREEALIQLKAGMVEALAVVVAEKQKPILDEVTALREELQETRRRMEEIQEENIRARCAMLQQLRARGVTGKRLWWKWW
jgi:NAD(P)H-dependent flavin oxidoreductase YrpB (nitropropane dioxygenase family)